MGSVRRISVRRIEAALLASAALVLVLGTSLRVATLPAIRVGAPSTSGSQVSAIRTSGSDSDRPATLRDSRTREEAVQLQWRATAWLLIAMAGAFAFKSVFRPKGDPFLLPSAALLASTGNMAIAGCKDPLRDAPAMLHHAEGVALAALVGAVAASRWCFDRPLHRYGYPAATVASALLLLLAMGGRGPGGVRLSIFGFQPAELVKILFVAFAAAYLASRGGGPERPARLRRTDVVPLIVLAAIPTGLFLLLKDLGPALLLAGALLVLATTASHRWRWIIGGSLALALAGWAAWRLGLGTLPTRVGMWWSPWNNPFRGGDHLASALWSASSGGWFGSGIGLAETVRLPRAGSDMVLASMLGEGGLPAGVAVLAAAAVPGWRAFRIASRCRSRFDGLLAIGLGALITLQAVLISAGSTGLLPLSGVSFPWSAYGTSSLVAQGICLGALTTLSHRASEPDSFRSRGILPSLAWIHAVVFGALALRCLQLTGATSTFFAVHAFEGRAKGSQRMRRSNPRLSGFALSAHRGTLRDSSGLVLAQGSGSSRTYPLGSDAAFVTGWIDPANGAGASHAERKFDGPLRGWRNAGELLGWWRSRTLPWSKHQTELEGQDVPLSVSAPLQRTSAAALRTTPTSRGAVVVLDSHATDPIAKVSFPAPDPNTIADAKLPTGNATGSLVDRAEGGAYPPGSTFKIVVAAALLANGLGDFRVTCRHSEPFLRWTHAGRTRRRGRLSDDPGEAPHGRIGLEEALAVSCNTYFSKAAIAVGAQGLRDMGTTLEIPMPDIDAIAERLPDTGIGQGRLAVSPASMARAMLHIARAARREPGPLPNGPEWHRLIAGLQGAVEHGTARGLYLPNRRIGAKTGTAQTGRATAPHAWIVGFEERPDRVIAFSVMVENGGYGGAVAAPVALRILESFPPSP